MQICPNCHKGWSGPYPCVQEAPLSPLGGAGGARYYNVLFIGKASSDHFPWAVVNDRVASVLGRALGLPVPDSVLYDCGGRWLFFSHYRGMPPEGEGDTPPPSAHGDELEAALQADSQAELRHGIVLFDLLVANNDRKADNVVLGNDGRIWLIDQANALFYRPYTWNGAPRSAGPERLGAVRANALEMYDRPHHYLKWLTDWSMVNHWCERIEALPQWQIESIVADVPDGLMGERERDSLIEFLLHQQAAIRGIISEYRTELFPLLAPVVA